MFGSPRIGIEDWADAIYTNVGNHNGSSWRIVNESDFVPQVPPLKSGGPGYIHIDNGWRIFAGAVPATIATERGTTPQPPDWWNPIKIAEDVKLHST